MTHTLIWQVIFFFTMIHTLNWSHLSFIILYTLDLQVILPSLWFLYLNWPAFLTPWHSKMLYTFSWQDSCLQRAQHLELTTAVVLPSKCSTSLSHNAFVLKHTDSLTSMLSEIQPDHIVILPPRFCVSTWMKMLTKPVLLQIIGNCCVLKQLRYSFIEV